MKNIVIFCSFMASLFGALKPNPHYFYDSDQVRYELYQTNGGESLNWLFFPGGPGADSSYLRSLVDELELPGNVWLIDLPGNGSNGNVSEDFDRWFEIFPRLIKQFDQPVVVGHSFGGMLPLLYPELEKFLKACVILNSTPVLWHEEALAYAKQFNLPEFTCEVEAFVQDPSQATFDKVIDVCMPYYFPKESLERGRALFSQTPSNYRLSVWGQARAFEGKLMAKWIPQQIPTLIIGGKYDGMCPFTLFNRDQRFHRENIKLLFIEDAGHCPWIENPAALKEAFKELSLSLAPGKVSS